jgi:hypothetical protein
LKKANREVAALARAAFREGEGGVIDIEVGKVE